MLTALWFCLLPIGTIISFQLGMEPPVSCTVFLCLLLSLHVNNFTLVIMAADKVVAVTFPFKHKKMMTRHVVAAVIGGAWLIAVIPTTVTITLDGDSYKAVPKYGICVATGSIQLVSFLTSIVPGIISSVLTIVLNAHLTIKAHVIHKNLSGQFESLKALKKKQHSIRQSKKSIATLLVIILGNASIDILL